MPQQELLACYRPTWRQVLGRSALGGGLAAVLPVGWAVQPLQPRLSPAALVGLTVLAVGAGFGLTALVLRRMGVDADEIGLTVTPVSLDRYAAWPHIVDIRTERRGSRRVAVVYLAAGEIWRLGAPYDGLGLGRDADFEPKVFTLRNLWENHRHSATQP